ncbi:hypothetical protein QQP08_003716 [Theobroma cacao]|nr:hypothetical protein QQP08_003716 [Theobroma cacao]
MGITGELVRSVFSRNRSFGTQDTSAKSNVNDKKRWSSVRSYICGDEFNSVLAEEDSTSVKSSEATVTQPIPEGLRDKGDIQSDEAKPDITEDKRNSIWKLFHEEDAAIVIQSAFRHFLVDFLPNSSIDIFSFKINIISFRKFGIPGMLE